MLIYHIADEQEWKQAVKAGEYRMSTRGRTLAEQGYIHASDADQVASVANAFYGSDDRLLILVIDVGRLKADVRYEDVPGSDRPFPHIYGPINVDAVIDTRPLRRAVDGRYSFPA